MSWVLPRLRDSKHFGEDTGSTQCQLTGASYGNVVMLYGSFQTQALSPVHVVPVWFLWSSLLGQKKKILLSDQKNKSMLILLAWLSPMLIAILLGQ